MVEELRIDVWDAPAGECFILGDCGPVAMFTDGKPRLALGTIDNEVAMANVFLPILPTRCIVGRRHANDRALSVAELNKISAALSHEFFVSNQPDDVCLTTLLKSIGSLVQIATEEDIVRLFAEDDPAP